MRLGLALWPDRDVRELAELAVAAENAGFDDLWWPDHYDAREVSAVLTLCAARTTRIRLGTAVTSPLLRHPGILGSLFASLGEASDGRAVAGLGPGGFEVKTNLKVTTPSPIAATREAVVILRALLAGERVTIEGGRVFLSRVLGSPSPRRAPCRSTGRAGGQTCLRWPARSRKVSSRAVSLPHIFKWWRSRSIEASYALADRWTTATSRSCWRLRCARTSAGAGMRCGLDASSWSVANTRRRG